MNILGFVFLTSVLTFGLYCLFYTTKKHVPWVLLVFYVCIGLFALQLMGRPVPISFEFFKDATLKGRVVVAEHFEYGKAIYVWILDRKNIPISYKLDWNDKTAKNLQQARQGAKGRRVVVGEGKEKDGQGEQMGGILQFIHEATPEMPPKKSPR